MSEETKKEERKNYGQLLRDAEGDIATQRELIAEFTRVVMVKGEDYGEIPGIDKPTLLKPGAEKLIALYRGGRDTQIVTHFEDWDAEYTIQKKNWKTKEYEDTNIRGLAAYTVLVTVRDKETGNILGSGVAGANTFEKKFASQGDGFQTQNTVVKMCEKRATVSAALTMSLVSGFFTQDMEEKDSDDVDNMTGGRATAARSASVSADADDWEVDFGAAQYKGQMFSTLPENSIKWYITATRKNIAEKPQYAAGYKAKLAIMEKVAKAKGVSI